MNSRSLHCRITVRGRLAPHWSRWLGELRLSYRLSADGGELTDLTGILPDQSALQGALKRIWNLNLTLLSVNTSPLETGGDKEPPVRASESEELPHAGGVPAAGRRCTQRLSCGVPSRPRGGEGNVC